jgi:hypothetical protein
MSLINPDSRPRIDASHHTHWATNICWDSLVYDIIFSRAYTIISLSVSKVMVIRYSRFLQDGGLPLQKANRFQVYNNRYRYHKNTIINKDISPLVGIVLS